MFDICAEFMGSPTSRRQALFARFSRRALAELSRFTSFSASGARPPLIILTGGVNTSALFASALRDKHADLLGVGRTSILYPELPKLLKDDQFEYGRQAEWIPRKPMPLNFDDPVALQQSMVEHGVATFAVARS